MIELNLDYICSCLGGKLLQGAPSLLIKDVSTDSRTVTSSGIFFALAGENFDGHNYVMNALQQGALAACVARPIDKLESFPERGIILVPDTLQALQDLARHYRLKFDIPIVGVTGSVGKTTTKDLITLCLQGSYRTLKSTGNYNNEIGLPLSLLQLNEQHQAAVIEMAMRQRGEIQALAHIASPTCAVITNVEPVHLETLGNLENIAQAKCEILGELKSGSLALINGDSSILVEYAKAYPINQYYFGYSESCHFRILSVETDGAGIKIETSLLGQVRTFYCPIPARRLASNVIAAVGLASLFGVEAEICQAQLMKYQPTEKRLNILYRPQGGIIINDTYNANPVSMAAALECGQELVSPGKWVAVLGDMFELGGNEEQGHSKVGQKAATSQVDLLVAVGERALFIAQGARDAGLPENRIRHFPSKLEALDYLSKILKPEDKVLFKASRGMRMETLIEELERASGHEDQP